MFKRYYLITRYECSLDKAFEKARTDEELIKATRKVLDTTKRWITTDKTEIQSGDDVGIYKREGNAYAMLDEFLSADEQSRKGLDLGKFLYIRAAIPAKKLTYKKGVCYRIPYEIF